MNNVETLILKNKEIHNLLPDLKYIFDQWLMSYRLPFLRNLRQQAKLDLINYLSEKEIKILEAYFKETIAINKLDYNLVKNITIDLGQNLSDFDGFNNFTLSRDSDKIYITFWR